MTKGKDKPNRAVHYVKVEPVLPRAPSEIIALFSDESPDEVIRKVNELLEQVGWSLTDVSPVSGDHIQFQLVRK